MKHALILCTLLLLLLPAELRAGGEEGGTGLLDIDQAFSLSIARPVFKLHGGYYSNDFGAGDARLISLTPSLTWGLGGGLEASAALPLEGVTTEIDGGDFDRRFDLRRSDPRAKLRWTGNLAGTRLRTGVQGYARLGVGDSARPGGTEQLDLGLDPGIDFLASGNIGHFSFPLRVHANAGYWFSRDDGSAWYRHHPVGFTLPAGVEGNDVFLAGVAVEAGFRRGVVFAELLTEQLVEARGILSSQENLWRFTPGVRTALTSTVELTAAVSFNLSEDDPATAFDPGEFFADYELRAGISLGSVLGQENYESRKRAEARERREEREAAARELRELRAAAARADSEPAPVQLEPETEAAMAEAMPPAPPEDQAARLSALEQRLRQLEVQTRLGLLEARLSLVEQGGWALPPKASVEPADSSRTPVPAGGITARELSLRAQLSALQRELRPPTPTPTPTPTEDPPTTPEEPAAEPPAEPMAELTAEPEAELTAEPEAELTEKVAAAPEPAPELAPEPAPDPAQPSARERELAAQVRALQAQVEAQRAAAASAAATERRVTLVDPTPRDSQPGGTATVITVPVEVGPSAPTSAPPAEVAEPVTTPATPESTPAVPVAPPEASPEEFFPLAPGEGQEIAGLTLGPAAAPLQGAEVSVLDDWALHLANHPQVKLAILVYSDVYSDDGADPERSLAQSEAQARAVRDYLVVAGASPTQLVPLGMGQPREGEANGPGLWLERVDAGGDR